ncbi:MAG: carbon starvation CstA family protein [bacterium]
MWHSNASLLILACLPIFVIAYFVYARRVGILFDESKDRKTPAVASEDGKDYVPADPLVLFGHHFASIAGGGPIIGPTIALAFGYLPVWMWIVVGTIFIGGIHDLSSLFVSIREGGRSIADITRRYLGKRGFILFISFATVYILLVTSAFLQMTVAALTSTVPISMISEDAYLGSLSREIRGGVEVIRIGGVASTSVIIITLFAPLLGYLLYRRRMNALMGAVIAAIVAGASIRVGISSPVNIRGDIWMVLVSVYVFIASGIPVWIVLQPRDFVNSFILFAGVGILLAGAIGGGLKGIVLEAPPLDLTGGQAALGSIWPALFIVVACGAISGFHALVASGTTSKQISSEAHARKIGYGAMVLEGILAVCVVTAVAAGMGFKDYRQIVYPQAGQSNPILAFGLGMGGLLKRALGLNYAYGVIFGIIMVEGFVVTTIDTAVRLNRYLFEEVWKGFFVKVPQMLLNRYFNSMLCVVLMYVLARTNAFLSIWPIFGTANQLLAALTLTTVTVWLSMRGKNPIITLAPAIFMLLTTIASLIQLLMKKYIPSKNITLSITAGLLFLLAIIFVETAVGILRRGGKR